MRGITLVFVPLTQVSVHPPPPPHPSTLPPHTQLMGENTGMCEEMTRLRDGGCYGELSDFGLGASLGDEAPQAIRMIS